MWTFRSDDWRYDTKGATAPDFPNNALLPASKVIDRAKSRFVIYGTNLNDKPKQPNRPNKIYLPIHNNFLLLKLI